MNLTREEKISELLYFYKENEIDYNNIDDFFIKHIQHNTQKIKISDLINNYNTRNILINTPDGYQLINNFWIKKERDCFLIKTKNHQISCSSDHLIETDSGWKKTSNLLKDNDKILTKHEYENILSIKRIKKQTVYDFEVDHINHRYWGGTGISSHNSGKTFLSLNIVREAQKQGYDIFWIDTENAMDDETMKRFDIDISRVSYQPIDTVEALTTFLSNLAKEIEDQKDTLDSLPKILIVVDSLGNLSTKKEMSDATSGSDKADMTRARELKKLFRVCSKRLGILKIPVVVTNHTYQSIGFISQSVVSGGCLTESEDILMDTNTYKKINEIKVGDYVQTLNGNKVVTNTFHYKKPTIKLHLDNGQIIECSKEHKFLINSNTMEWKTADELNENDEILSL